MSPEVIQKKPYCFKSDIWGAGCLLYEMMTFKKAFDGRVRINYFSETLTHFYGIFTFFFGKLFIFIFLFSCIYFEKLNVHKSYLYIYN